MRFMNDDYKIKHGGRKAARISEAELKQKILDAALAADADFLDDVLHPRDEQEVIEAALYSFLYEEDPPAQLDKDNKYYIGFDNITLDSDFYQGGENYLGINTIGDFTFCGFIAAADCEVPAYLVLYWDGKRLRMYIPTYGNYVNTIEKSGIGDELMWGKAQQHKEKYEKLGAWVEDGWNGEDVDYCRIYGLSKHDDCQQFNWGALEEDFTSRIVVQ